MNTLTLQEAQAALTEVVRRLSPGEQIILTDGGRPVAQLVGSSAAPRQVLRPRPPVTGVPKAGRWKGLLMVPPDFKEPLEELREYVE